MSPDLPQSATIFSDPWQLILAMSTASPADRGWVLQTEGGRFEVHKEETPRGWAATVPVPPAAARMLDLYVPLLGASDAPYVLAHLGQSIDGYVAGADGESRTLNGEENIMHLHRLRALFDVVLVGCNTAGVDNPRLTTRLVAGENPTRVIVDPQLKCERDLGLFTDGAAPTILCCAADAPERTYPSGVDVLRLQQTQDHFNLRALLDALRSRGLSRIFIEGGGQTVSRALEEGVLDRLQVAVAPVLIGGGIKGIHFGGPRAFSAALRPCCTRFSMGADVLFDFELSSSPLGASQ